MKYLLAFLLLLSTPLHAQTIEHVEAPQVEASQSRESIEYQNWKKVEKLEIAFQIINAADFATTAYCLKKLRTCHEANPLIGRDPSLGKLLAVKAGTGIVHYYVVKHVSKRNPEAARIFQIISIGVYGGVVAANLRFVFK